MSRQVRRTFYTALLLAVAAAGVWATSHTVHTPTAGDWLGVVGGYVTAVAYMVLVLAFLLVVERLLVPQLDFFEQIANGNIAVGVFAGLLVLAFALAAGTVTAQPTPEREGQGVWDRTRCINPGAQMPIVAFALPARGCAVADTARRWVGVVERPPGSNEGPGPERFLSSVGLSGGYAWCAAFGSYVYDQAPGPGPVGPEGNPVRTAGATDFRRARRTIDPAAVRRGRRAVPAGAGVIWKRRGTWKGHFGIVAERWTGRCGKTIEGNTSPGA